MPPGQKRPPAAARSTMSLMNASLPVPGGLSDRAARLIRRRADPADGRRVLVDLTPFGKTVSERTDGTIEDGVRRALRKASARDIDATRRVLTAIARELDDSRSGREASTPATGVDS